MERFEKLTPEEEKFYRIVFKKWSWRIALPLFVIFSVIALYISGGNLFGPVSQDEKFLMLVMIITYAFLLIWGFYYITKKQIKSQ